MLNPEYFILTFLFACPTQELIICFGGRKAEAKACYS